MAGDGTESAADILEDTPSVGGQTVSALFGGQFADALDLQASVTNPTGSAANTLAGIAIPALVFGFWLWFSFFWGSGAWIHAKLTLVAAVCAYHWYCYVLLKRFEAGQNTHSHVWYRWFNEAPVILMLAIVALAVIKPF